MLEHAKTQDLLATPPLSPPSHYFSQSQNIHPSRSTRFAFTSAQINPETSSLPVAAARGACITRGTRPG